MCSAAADFAREFWFAPEYLTVVCSSGKSLEGSDVPVITEFVSALVSGITEPEIWNRFGSFHTGAILFPCFQTLRLQNRISYELRDRYQRLLTVEPVHEEARWHRPTGSGVISRFAFLRRADDGWRAECPDSDFQLKDLSPEVLPILMSAADGQVVSNVVDVLDRAGFLERPAETSEMPSWEFHDRLFHQRSSRYGSREGYGATWRFRDEYAVPLPEQQRLAGSNLPLEKPGADSELLSALSTRRTERRHGAAPLTLEQLSAVLYHSLRITGTREPTVAAASVPTFHKNYPSAGGIHELRAYLAVQRCTGLIPGMYRYDEHAHALTRLPASSELSSRVIEEAGTYRGTPGHNPDTVLLLTSRLDLLACKYEKIAYRLTLLNAGCAMQTICLAASALSVACCPLGAIDGLLFGELSRLGEVEGIAVAKLALGSLPERS